MATTSSSLWQKPFVNVFKLMDITGGSWANVTKEGNVRQVLEKDIGKNVVRVSGTTSASNFVSIPSNKSRAGLGLTGSFLYLQLKPMGPKLFTIHVELLTRDNFVTRVTISNMFRVYKRRGNTIQVPVDLEEKWYTLAFDLPYLLSSYKDHSHSDEYWCVKGMKICSNVLVRNAYTSETGYAEEETFPKVFQVSHALGVGEVVWVPDQPSNVHYESANQVPKHSVAAGKGNLPSPTTTKTTENKENVKQQRKQTTTNAAAKKKNEVKKSSPKESPAIDYGLTKTIREPSRQILLRPDPIMELKTYVGYSATLGDSAKAIWSREGQKVIFASSSNVIVASPDRVRQEQVVLFGHTTNVNCLAVDHDGVMLASSQSGKNPVIRLWDLSNGKCVALIAACIGGDLHSLDFSGDDRLLCATGRDEHNRVQICVWDISGVLAHKTGQANFMQQEKVVLVAKQTSEFDITCVKFAPYDSSQLVSCGRENIRFWRVRDRHLPGCPTVLNEHARGCVFTDLAFESNFGGGASNGLANISLDRRVFVAGDNGSVAVIQYDTRKLLCIYRLHDGPINSIDITEGFCVTGSSDRYARVWPLDFNDFFSEVSNQAPVSSVKVSTDGLKILVGTTDGNLSMLDVTTHSHSVLMQTHSGDINSVAFRPVGPCSEIATGAENGVYVWSVPSCEQKCEFTSMNDACFCLAYLPDAKNHILVCGYRSGFLRVFNIAQIALTHEFRQHVGPICGLGISADGSRTFSYGLDGQVCVYDNRANFQPIRMISIVPNSSGLTQPNNQAYHYHHQLTIDNEKKVLAVITPNRKEVVLIANILSNTLDAMVPVLRIKRPSRAFSNKECHFQSVHFSRNGRTELIVTTDDNRISKFRVFYDETQGWSSTIVRDIHSFHPDYVSAVAVSPQEGAFLASSGSDNIVQIWDAKMRSGKTGVPSVQRFLGHSDPVSDICFSPDCSYVVSVGAQTMIVWSFLGNEEDHMGQYSSLELERSQISMSSLALELERANLEAGDDVDAEEAVKKLLVHYKPRPGRPIPRAAASHKLTEHKHLLGFNVDSCSNLIWHPNSGLFAYASGGTLVKEDLSTQIQQHFTMHRCDISAIALSPNAKVIATGSGQLVDVDNSVVKQSSEILLWHVEDDQKICAAPFSLVGHLKSGVQALAFSPDNKLLVSIGAYPDSMLSVWSVDHGTLLCSEPVPVDFVNDVLWSRGNSIVVCGAQGYIGVWTFDESNGELSGVTFQSSSPSIMAEIEDTFTVLAEAPKWIEKAHESETVVVVGDNVGKVTIVAFPQQTVLATWQGTEDEITSISWCDKNVICGERTGSIVSWDVSKRYPAHGSTPSNVMRIGRGEPILDMKWQAQGNDGVLMTKDCKIFYANIKGDEIVPIQTGLSHAKHLCSSFDGSFVAACGGDDADEKDLGCLRIWTVDDLDLVSEIIPEKCKITSCCFLRDHQDEGTRFCLAGFADGTVRVIHIESEQVVSKYQVFTNGSAVSSLANSSVWVICASSSGQGVAIQVDLRNGALKPSEKVDLMNDDENGDSNEFVGFASSKFIPELVAGVDSNGNVLLFEFQAKQIQKLMALEERNVTHCSFSDRDPDLLFCFSKNDRTVLIARLDDLTKGVIGQISMDNMNSVNSMDGDFVGTVNGDIFRIEGKHKMDLIFAGHVDTVTSIVSLPSRSSFFSATRSELVRHEI